MERARYNTELYSNPGPLLNNVKPSNFWGSHQFYADCSGFFIISVGNYFTRSPYERSVVLTRIFSPMLMKRGAIMMAPVSRVISF